MSTRTVAWILGVGMIACAALANWLVPTARPDKNFNLETLVPASFGQWSLDTSVIPVSPSPDVQANLDKIYDQMVTRAYRNANGDRIMLVVAYGGDQSDSLKAHRQEVCYQAQGFSIKQVANDSLHVAGGDIPLVRMHAVKGRRSEPVTYWFTMGNRVAMGRGERLVAQVGYGLQGRIPDGLLVRVSSISGDPQASYEAHDEFLRDLLVEVGPQGRERLAGLSPAAS